MEKLKISAVMVLWLIVSLSPASASLGSSMSSNTGDSSLSNAFGANSTNKSASSLQVNSENKSSIADILNETASQMDNISKFNGELINALNNGATINVTNQANQTYGNLVTVHNVNELKIGDIISFQTNLTNPLMAVIHLLLVNIDDDVFIFKMVNASNMNSFVNFSVNRTELESSWGNNTNTVIRPLQYNETQAEQFLLELANPSKGISSSGIIGFIKEHKALLIGGAAVAVLAITGTILSFVISCCSRKSTHRVQLPIPSVTTSVAKSVTSTLNFRDLLGADEMFLSDIWEEANAYFDNKYVLKKGENIYQSKVVFTRIQYASQVYNYLNKRANVKHVRWNLDMKYITFAEVKNACTKIFARFYERI